jgi:hypothetical protein
MAPQPRVPGLTGRDPLRGEEVLDARQQLGVAMRTNELANAGQLARSDRVVILALVTAERLLEPCREIMPLEDEVAVGVDLGGQGV